MSRKRVKESFELSDWRLISSSAEDGATSMAFDEAIFEAVAQEQSPPTLRISGWKPGFLSIGQHQTWDIVDKSACIDHGWNIVRRQTPGRAILHIDGLSVCVTINTSDSRAAGSGADQFGRISTCLKYALEAMGLDADRSQPYYEDRGPSGKAFYDGPSDYQVIVGGRKLVCGAMLSNESAVMIQCTLPLFGDLNRITGVLNFDLPGERLALVARLGYRAATLESLLGKQPDMDEVATYLQDGFTKGLNVSLNEGGLSELEISRAANLREVKYNNANWTKRS